MFLQREKCMRRQVLLIGLLVGIAMLDVSVYAQTGDRDNSEILDTVIAVTESTLTCYQLSAFPEERYKLDIKGHSRLSEREGKKLWASQSIRL
jgi:hypothetical protein